MPGAGELGWGARGVEALARASEKGGQAASREIGGAVGHLARFAAFPVAAPAYLAGKGLAAGAKGVARRVGSGMIQGAARNPMTFALNIAGGGLLGKQMLGLGSPAAAKAGTEQAQQAARFLTKRSSMDDVQMQLIIRRGLEKRAASTHTINQLIGDALDRAMGQVSKASKKAAKDAADAKPKPADPNKRMFSIFGREGQTGTPDYSQYLLAGLALGTAATVAGMGGQAAASGAGKVGEMTHRLGRNRHYNAMVEADPTLKRYPQTEVKRTFAVLHKASPYVAKEPLLAASAVRSIVDAPRPDMGSKTPNISLDAVQRILNVEAGRQGTRYPLLQETKDVKQVKTDLPNAMLG